MNIKVQPKIHNRFDIFKKNVATGEEKQVGYAENIVLDQMWTRLCSGSTYFVNIHYGTGTGTLASTRTSLFTHLGTAAASNVETVRAIPTSHWRRSITLGLTTANGSELTEVGIAYGSTASNLVTHAQIRDMNGNVISILKTDVDIITIYATVYITMVNTDANVKLLHPNNNGLLSYLLGGSFPAAIFYTGMSGVESNYPPGLVSYNIGSSPSGSWSNDVANKKRLMSEVRFGTTAANGHIKELVMSNIARMVLPVTGIYSGLELSGVSVGIGDGETTIFELPSANIDQTSLVVKVDGTPTSVTKQNIPLLYGTVGFQGGGPSGSMRDVAFTSDSSTLAVASEGSPYLTLFEKNNGVWNRLPDVSGGLPSLEARGVAISPNGEYLAVTQYSASAVQFVIIYKNIGGVWTRQPNISSATGKYGAVACFSPDNSILVVTNGDSPYLSMYKDIDGVWTRMPTPSGGNPTAETTRVAFSPDGSILAVPHWNGMNMYKDIDGVWTKMPAVTGGNPPAPARSCSFSPDGKYLAVSGSNSPYFVLYEDVDGVWTKVPITVNVKAASGSFACSFSGDGTLLASIWYLSGESDHIELYENVNGVWTISNKKFDTASSYAYCGRFSPDAKSLITKRPFTIDSIMTQIEFAIAPAVGAVITADYTVNGIHKTDQRVIDISGEIQFGEPTP